MDEAHDPSKNPFGARKQYKRAEAGDGAADKAGDHGQTKKTVLFKTLAEFIAEYVPLSYVVELIVRDASLYSLTGRTGCGKTSFLVVLAIAVALGLERILGKPVEQGRVAFLTAENPDDLRMKFMVACFFLNIASRKSRTGLSSLTVVKRPKTVSTR